MEERLDPFDREMMRYRRRRLSGINLNWRSAGCLVVIVTLLLGCSFSKAAFEALSVGIEAWRNPTPTPRPTIIPVMPPTPPAVVITPQPGNAQPVSPVAACSTKRA